MTTSSANTAKGAAALQSSGSSTGRRLAFSGTLTIATLASIEKALFAEVDAARGTLVFDLTAVSVIDTAGALLLRMAEQRLSEGGVSVSYEGTDDERTQLIKRALPDEGRNTEKNENPAKAKKRPGQLVTIPTTIGKWVCDQGEVIAGLVSFLGQFMVTLAYLALHPARVRWTSLIFHMDQVGLKAVPIVSLLTFLIGLVVAYMGAQQLSMFGADIFAVNLLEVTVMREMGVLITSIVVAGRSSSSFTAQIGSMVSNEEVDAMRSMGLDPVVLLVMPRVTALILCLPMLVFLADMMGMLGGAVAIRMTIGLSLSGFITQLQEVAQLQNFFVGMVKTPFFAMAIGLVGCFQGFRATGSAESVGFLTTVSVVQAIFTVILLDALFAIFFTTIGV